MSLRMTFDTGMLEYDLVQAGSSFEEDDGLETAVIVSLFTDRRASEDELESAGLPRNYYDRRGWWWDPTIGSLLWLLRRYGQTDETLQLAQEWAAEALEWLLDDGIAAAVTVLEASWAGERLQLPIEIVRPDGTRWSSRWDALTAERL